VAPRDFGDGGERAFEDQRRDQEPCGDLLGRAPDDLRRASHAKDLDKTGHLVEQVSVAIVLAGFAPDDRGYKPRGDIVEPAGVLQYANRCSHRTTHPSKLRQCRVLKVRPECLTRG
jgi:hypothetical protein